jgi:hypothetical protein
MNNNPPGQFSLREVEGVEVRSKCRSKPAGRAYSSTFIISLDTVHGDQSLPLPLLLSEYSI